jgi:coenzyme PQQ synthesis protein D (PqqD)
LRASDGLGRGLPLGPETVLRIRPQVFHRRLGDETIILKLDSGTYFGLDEVGSRAWELIQSRGCLAEVLEALVAEYEVTAEDLWRDLESLVGRLLDHGLVEVQVLEAP